MTAQAPDMVLVDRSIRDAFDGSIRRIGNREPGVRMEGPDGN